MDVKHPRRILFVGPPEAGALDLISDLTGSAPTSLDGSTAGLSHIWPLKTSYYKADIPIWIDEIVNVETWRDEFMKKEAKEVVSSLGGWVYCFRKPVVEDDLVSSRLASKVAF
jgi:hypothetical protein